MDINAAQLVPFLKEESERTGTKITVTHAIIKALGQVLKLTPEVNGRLVLGRYYPSDTADVGCLVNMRSDQGFDLGLTKVTDADSKSLADVARSLQRNAASLRSGKDEFHEARKPVLEWMPTFLLEPVVAVTGWLASLGITIRTIGVQGHPFGTAIVTSVGMLGLDMCFVPHTPFARVPVLVMVGKLQLKPHVNQDTKELTLIQKLPVTFTVDHRFLDGSQGAIMAQRFQEIMETPSKFLV